MRRVWGYKEGHEIEGPAAEKMMGLADLTKGRGRGLTPLLFAGFFSAVDKKLCASSKRRQKATDFSAATGWEALWPGRMSWEKRISPLASLSVRNDMCSWLSGG